MLNICADTLPQTCLSYVAFRVSFQETLERFCLARQMGDDVGECHGYLAEVPFLRAVPAHVQLDLLIETWAKHFDAECFDANLVDESVVYAAYKTAARIVEHEPDVVRRYLRGGPLDAEVEIDYFLASDLRSLHLNLSNDGDFLMISQFEDMPPDEARRMKREFKIDEQRLEPMFEVLAHWTMSANFISHLGGLLTNREIVRAVRELATP